MASSLKDSVVIREGKLAGSRSGFGFYQIGYDAIVPKRGECSNLLVTFALSASHTAFASVRMEPVFMITSQSAATSAVRALEDGKAVQEVSHETLREQLVKGGQVVEWKK